jgi:repressor LexA
MKNELSYDMDRDRTGIPILGRVAAGMPKFSDSVELGYLQHTSRQYDWSDRDIFALQVSGDSMIEDGIYDGNYIVVRHDRDFRNGDIVIAYVNEEATVKRAYRRGNKIILQPANSELQPIEVNPAVTDFRVGGRVIDVVRRQ